MSSWAFCKAVMGHAAHRGFERSHILYFLLVLVSAVPVVLWHGHGEESVILIAIPLIALAAVAAYEFLRHARDLWQVEHTKRLAAERDLVVARSGAADQQAKANKRKENLASINALIDEGNRLSITLKESNNIGVPDGSRESVLKWANRAAAIIKKNFPEFSAHFESDAGFGVEPVHAGSIERTNAINFVNRRLVRLGELLHRA